MHFSMEYVTVVIIKVNNMTYSSLVVALTLHKYILCERESESKVQRKYYDKKTKEKTQCFFSDYCKKKNYRNRRRLML